METLIQLLLLVAAAWVLWKLLGHKLLSHPVGRALKSRWRAYQVPEEAYYAKVAEEIERGQIRPGLWTKAMAQCGSNTQQIHATYIKLRVESLRRGIAGRLSELSEESGHSPEPSGSNTKVVVDCPHCSSKLRVPCGKNLRVKCSKCGLEFGTKT
jgi:hypothetical protein